MNSKWLTLIFSMVVSAPVTLASELTARGTLCAETSASDEICLIPEQRSVNFKSVFILLGSVDSKLAHIQEIPLERIYVNTHDPELNFSGTTSIVTSGVNVTRKVYITIMAESYANNEGVRGGEITVADDGKVILKEPLLFAPLR